MMIGVHKLLLVFILCLHCWGLKSLANVHEGTYSKRSLRGFNISNGTVNLQEGNTNTIQVRSRLSCAKTCKVTENCSCFKLGRKFRDRWECVLSSQQMVVGSDAGEADEYCSRCPEGYHLQLGIRCYKYSGHNVTLRHDQANQVCRLSCYGEFMHLLSTPPTPSGLFLGLLVGGVSNPCRA